MKILLIGDSIVASLVTNGVAILQAGGHTVTSIAVAGNTTADQLAAWQASPVRGDATYDVGVIQVGINDIRTAVALATTLSNFATLINDIRANNPTLKIILGLMLPARTAVDVIGSYASKYQPIQAAILAAGTGLDIPAVDRIMTSANAAFNDGTDAMNEYDSGDHLHPSVGGNRLNAVEFRANINALFGLVDPVPVGGASRSQRQILGMWRRADMPASSSITVNRATGQSTATQVRRRAKIVGFTATMDTLGAANPAAGSALTLKVIVGSWQGYNKPEVTIGTVDVGESNVTKPSLVEIQLEAGDVVYMLFVTDGSWTSTTCDPAVTLETQEN